MRDGLIKPVISLDNREFNKLLGLASHEAQLRSVYATIKGRFTLNLAINNYQ